MSSLFLNSPLAAGTYEMEVYPPEGVDLAPAFIPNIVVTTGVTTTVDVTLEEGGLISGRVTCYAGHPVAFAEVSVWDPVTWVHGWARTDDQGNYTITGLSAGTYEMRVSPPPGLYLPALISDIVVVAGQTTTVDVTLEAGGRVSGRITDPDGVGVAGAGIRVNGWGTTTEANGSFTTIGLLLGIYEMKVTPPEGVDLAPARIPGIEVIVGETTIVNVVLRLPGDATGDGKVDASDLTLVAGAFNTQDAASDINADGIVDIFDLVQVGRNFGRR